ncbi:MAG: GNAT family N-acetyltransferase [Nocardioidaceae bacterium]|nr:GNAT family N-acetyltransferase [Nocardioidaceae bacterium]NUS50695.1 GNAT family N-acetyltransferase [Nocardioidaceae bacterium]
MDARPLDLADDAEVQQFYDVSWRAEMDDGRPWNVHWSREELLTTLREPTADQRMEGFVVVDGDRVVASGVLGLSLRDNVDKAWAYPMVDPPRRRAGAGTALVGAMLARCRELGRPTVSMNAAYAGPEDPDAPPVAFALSLGFRQSYSEIFRRLDLPVPADLLDRLDGEGRAHHDGYQIETYVGDVPDHLLPSYCALVNLLGVDAPSGDVTYEAAGMTPDSARERSEQNKRMGRRVFHALAVRDREAVAMTDLAVVPSGDEALQWATYVHRQHRGHRLGAAVKVANLRALQEQCPEVTRVDTENAETNKYMVSINEALGFEIVAVSPHFVLEQEI